MHVRNAGGADETEIILRSKKKYPIIVVQTNDNTTTVPFATANSEAVQKVPNGVKWERARPWIE